MRFRITGLPVKRLSYLFRRPDTEPAAPGTACEITGARGVDDPCRISATDPKRGREPAPASARQHAARSTYRLHFASYMNNARPNDGGFEVPEHLSHRTLAVWGFDSMATMVGVELTEGRDLKNAIERLLATPGIAYLHVYVAQPARYAAWVERS